jgi:very-short-patch-repair endonuclease
LYSDIQEKCYKLLRLLFPLQKIEQNYYVKYRGGRFYIDFYLPLLGLAIEVDGKQHYERVKHFHRTTFDFQASLYRDRRKEEWAIENGIVLIRLTEEELRNLDMERFGRVLHERFNKFKRGAEDNIK